MSLIVTPRTASTGVEPTTVALEGFWSQYRRYTRPYTEMARPQKAPSGAQTPEVPCCPAMTATNPDRVWSDNSVSHQTEHIALPADPREDRIVQFPHSPARLSREDRLHLWRRNPKADRETNRALRVSATPQFAPVVEGVVR